MSAAPAKPPMKFKRPPLPFRRPAPQKPTASKPVLTRMKKP
eukprot:gene17798-32722_t